MYPQAKLQAGELTQREFDLILGTHHLGVDAVSPDGGDTNERPEPTEQGLTFDDIHG